VTTFTSCVKDIKSTLQLKNWMHEETFDSISYSGNACCHLVQFAILRLKQHIAYISFSYLCGTPHRKSIRGMILTRENRSTGRNMSSTDTLFAPDLTRIALGLNTVLRGQRHSL
jgi:hypothetical protein